jgi:hypothetical protein
MKEVTDVAILNQLNGKEVTDPTIIAQLEGKSKKPSLSFMQQLAKAGTSSLPAIGAVVGSAPGVIGTPFTGGASLPLAVAGAAGGAGIGASLQNIIEQTFGLSDPKSTGQQYADIGTEMLYGGLSPAGGNVGSKVVTKTLGSKLTPAMEKVAEIATENKMPLQISALRPESKMASLIDTIIGKVPGANLLQLNQLGKVEKGMTNVATATKENILTGGVKAAMKEEGLKYQEALSLLPEKMQMPKTVEYLQSMLDSEGFKGKAKEYVLGLIKSADAEGNIPKEMLDTFKAQARKSLSGTTAKRVNNLLIEDMATYSQDAADLWSKANQNYAFLGKMKPVENVFKRAIENKKGYEEFNPAKYIEAYDEKILSGDIPDKFKATMDSLRQLAELGVKNAKNKAEFNWVSQLMPMLLGGGSISAGALLAPSPSAAIGVSALMLARSATAQRGILRKLATTGVMSKEATNVLGKVLGVGATMELAE